MKIVFLALFSIITIISFGQANKYSSWDNQRISIAFNGDQLIEKVGMEKILHTLFDNGAVKTTKDSEKIRKNSIFKKSIAAMYGAGIDFDKKIWMLTLPNKDTTLSSYDYNPQVAFIIPMKNRDVMIEAFKNIIDNREIGKFDKSFKSLNNTNYYFGSDDQGLLVFTDKELIITNVKSYYDYDYNNINGHIIRRDTIKEQNRYSTPPPPPPPLPSTLNTTEKPLDKVTFIEVDKWENGKIVRKYIPKEIKEETNVDSDRMSAADTSVAEATVVDVAVAAPIEDTVVEVTALHPLKVEMETSAAAVTESVAVAAATAATNEYGTTKKHKKNAIDTLSQYVYINDSIHENVYYIPYTTQELEKIEKDKETIRSNKKEKYVTSFINDYQNILVYNTNKTPDMLKIINSKEDIAILSNYYMGNIMGMKTYLTGYSNQDDYLKGITSVSFYNFENGKLVAKVQPSCCNENSKKLNEMYLPITNFWPKELNAKSYGIIRYNFNIPLAINYYKSIVSSTTNEDLEKELRKENLELNDLAKIFNGEVAITIGTSDYDNYRHNRTMPNAVIAFKIKDAKKAVEVFNKIANKELKSSAYYRFNENGEYLLVSTDKNFFKQTKKINTEIPQLSYGNYGDLKFDLKNFLNSIFSYDIKEKKYNEFARPIEFFGNISAVNNKNEEGTLSYDFEMDLGDKNTNSLKNIMDLGINMAKDSEERNKRYETEYAASANADKVKSNSAKKSTPKKVVKTTKKTVKKK